MNNKSTERFSDRVQDYIRYRPHYPRQIVSLLHTEIGLRPSWTVADIGSGTGFSCELFLEHGNTVYGIEPNKAMRGAAERLLARYSHFKSADGTAEATTLPDKSVDLVIAGQAFHWFDPVRTRAEFLRILRPDGWVVLFWNSRRIDSTPFLKDYEELLLRHGTDYQQVRHDKVSGGLLERFFQGDCRRLVLPNDQILDFEGLKGRLLSSSYTPAEGDPARTRMLENLEDLFQRHASDGVVRMEYDTEIWIGSLSRR